MSTNRTAAVERAGELRVRAELRLHAQAALVPAMPAEEFGPFCADIAERGLLVPLEVTKAGVVLDGRARLQAAEALGLELVPVRLVAPRDEREHMLLAALRRRQLSASQRAALALELEEYRRAKVQAEERRQANLKGQSEVAVLPPRGEKTRELAARLAGVSARTVQDAATVREASPELYAALKAGTLPAHRAARQVRRARRHAEIGAAPALPQRPFELIYADPPWQLGNPDGAYAPENHYPTMPLCEIAALTLPAAEDAVLFLWAVNSHLPAALEVIAAWGFRYVSNLVWVKQSIGLGTWVRHRHELLFMAVRGKFSPAEPSDRPDSVIEAKRRRHSQKPDCVYELLERMYPHASKLELFARSARPGWTAWGNEVAQ